MTPIAVTIAGSDSGGGAGIQADLKTVSALGVYGASVVTALTAQNTKGVTGIHDVPPDLIGAPLAQSEDEMRRQAEALMLRGARAVLIKGGHGSSAESVDILLAPTSFTRLATARV